MYRFGIVSFLLLLPLWVQASSIENQIDDVTRYQEQKNIFEEHKKKQIFDASNYTELKTLLLDKDSNNSEVCIDISDIEVDGVTIISSDIIDEIIEPYLNKCNSIKQLNIMVKKINNEYIKEAYITSRAYIKAQDMSKGKLTVSVMEGKIESVEGKNISTSLVFPFTNDNNLNLRKLEMGVEQLNRLQSVQTKMDIEPGRKKGYSKIVMNSEKISSPFHGSIGINNYGTQKSGKYQLSGGLSYDNLLGINDFLSVNINTTSKQDHENNSLGDSISWALPIGQNYLRFSYSDFNYKQIVNGLNVDYESRGKSKSYQINLEHKLFHNKTQRGKIDFSLSRKKNDNYLADVFLKTSSSKLTVMNIGYTHNFSSETSDGYGTITYHRGLNWFGTNSGSIDSTEFEKYTLDLSYNKKISSGRVPVRYSFFLHGQYAKQGILGSEQIGMGGPYSVRGFKSEGSLSGNTGAYMRNELSYIVKNSWGSYSPYFGLDMGAVKHNVSSHGGEIIGTGVGTRFNINAFSLDLFWTTSFSDSNSVVVDEHGFTKHNNNSDFTGLNFSYRF